MGFKQREIRMWSREFTLPSFVYEIGKLTRLVRSLQHKDYFVMKRAFEKKQREQERADNDKARGDDDVGETSVDLGEGEATNLGASFSDLKLGA